MVVEYRFQRFTQAFHQLQPKIKGTVQCESFLCVAIAEGVDIAMREFGATSLAQTPILWRVLSLRKPSLSIRVDQRGLQSKRLLFVCIEAPIHIQNETREGKNILKLVKSCDCNAKVALPTVNSVLATS